MAVSTDDLIALKARGLSYQQIANNTGLTYNAVRGRVRRAGKIIVDDVSELELLRRENADENKLLVRMHLSRHGMGGGDTEYPFDINPASGLFLESNWLKEKA